MFRIDQLRAVSLASASNDVRFYLNGVHIEEGIMIATDGYRMHIARLDTPIAQPVTIPIDTVQTMLKIAGRKIPEFDLEHLDGALWAADIGGTRLTFTAVDGKFPEWRWVLPVSIAGIRVSGETAQFRPEYLADVQTAASYLLGKKASSIYVHHNGTGAAVVTTNDPGFCAVVMPWVVSGNVDVTWAAA